jgi:hypothetical protein
MRYWNTNVCSEEIINALRKDGETSYKCRVCELENN